MINFSLLNNMVLLVGKRKSGKSVLLRYLLLNEGKKFKKIFLFCPTEKINGFYHDIIPDNCIYDSFNDDFILKLMDKMAIVNKGKNMETADHVLLILDDMGRANRVIEKLYTRGRHYFLSVIQTSQYLYGVQPVCRSNADFVLVGQSNQQAAELMADEYLYGSLERKDFLRLYKKMCSKNAFMLINCNSVEDNDVIDDIYASIKCPAEYVK